MMARSPSAIRFGVIGRRLHLHDVLLGELLEIAPAEIARDLEGRVHDGAAIGRDAP